MRKLLAIAATAAVATVAFGAAPAHATSCPEDTSEGTLPGTSPKATSVAAGGETIYVDDRDFTDSEPIDKDANGGGLWIYLESKKKAGLQRGGDQVAFSTLKGKGVDPDIPTVDPIVTPVPNPTKPGEKVTLLPNGAGGGSVSEEAGEHDPCTQDIAINRDNIIF